MCLTATTIQCAYTGYNINIILFYISSQIITINGPYSKCVCLVIFHSQAVHWTVIRTGVTLYTFHPSTVGKSSTSQAGCVHLSQVASNTVWSHMASDIGCVLFQNLTNLDRSRFVRQDRSSPVKKNMQIFLVTVGTVMLFSSAQVNRQCRRLAAQMGMARPKSYFLRCIGADHIWLRTQSISLGSI